MGILDRFLRPNVERLAEQRAGEMVREYMGGFQLTEAAYDSTFDFEFGQPFAGNTQASLEGMPVPDKIREWTPAEREEVIRRAHFLWERNSLAKGAIRVIRGFVVSTGLSITYRNPRVKAILEQFRVDNRRKIQRWERQWFEQLLRDGEVFVRIVGNGQQGELVRADAVTLKPWLVEYVESAEGNRDDVVAYHVHPETGTGAPGYPQIESGKLERIDASEIVHGYINTVGYEVRGRSELFAIMPWLRAYNDWLANRARINRYKGFLYHLQLKDATQGQVNAKRSAFRQPPAPGSVYVSSDKEVLNDMGGNVGADRAAEDGRQIKLMALIGFPIPEYMVSEGENANLATARSQQLPALRSFLAYQDIYTQEVWRPVYEAVLQLAGLDLDGEIEEYTEDEEPTGKMIRIYESFEVTAQQIVDDDPKELAEALTLHQQNGWASKSTIAARAGYDWRVEEEKIDAEDQADAAAVMAGRKLGNELVPSIPGRNGRNEPEEDEEP